MTASLARPTAAEIHALVAGRWAEVLAALGVDAETLKNRHGPCPGCGGEDRFRFDDRDGRGTWICSGQSSKPLAGDGFSLLQHVHGWGFHDAWQAVVSVVGEGVRPAVERKQRPAPRQIVSGPTARVRALLNRAVEPEAVDDAVRYLSSRKLWPLPPNCTLRAHAGAEYWEGKDLIGRFPALLSEVRDVRGELVTVHVTYLQNGAKLTGHRARKILSPMAGREGCAVRVVPMIGEVMGIAEGVETALAAHAIHIIPVWAALNATMLTKFVPPPGVRKLVIFADRDVAGLESAWGLRDHTEIRCELRVPRESNSDWADEWARR